MVDALQKANEIQDKNLSKSKLKELKRKEQSGRKLVHRNNRKGSCGAVGNILNIATYGSDEYSTDEECPLDTSSAQKHTKKCECGSFEHRSICHNSCPLNKRRKQLPSNRTDDESSDEECPLNASSAQNHTKKCKYGSVVY